VSLRRLVIFACLALCPAAARAQPAAELRWGGDAEGGAPYVEADPDDPSRVTGFDVDVAQLLASALGRTPRFIQVGFTSIDAAAARADFDVGLSGIEDSAARRSRLAVTIPYYEFREVLTVRATDKDRGTRSSALGLGGAITYNRSGAGAGRDMTCRSRSWV
jgi:ABC-type amino acid transport substrate-binding protein